MSVSLGIGGWTRIGPSPDTRHAYVASTGNDANPGTITLPKRTIASARSVLRNGSPDHLHLKSGDTFDDTFGQWNLSGRSASEPMVLTSYGAGPRPMLRTGKQHGIVTNQACNNLAIVGLDFWAHQYTGSPGCAAFLCQGGGSNVLIEDCGARGFNNGAVFTGGSGRWNNVKMRRNVIVDSWDPQGTGGNGLYTSDYDGFLLEENTFDANGWTSAHPHAGIAPGHSAYFQDGGTGAVVRGNIAATTDGFQLRSGGVMEDNLFLGCAIPMVFGWGMTIAPSGINATVRRNVALDSCNPDASHSGGWGMLFANLADSEISENILAHRVGGSQPHAMVIQTDGVGIQDVLVRKNVIHNWGGSIQIRGQGSDYNKLELVDNLVNDPQGRDALISHDDQSTASSQCITSRNNKFFHGGSGAANTWFNVWGGRTYNEWRAMVGDTTSVGGPIVFPDSSRDIGKYHASIGGAASLAAFMAQARLQSKANWRRPYTAAAVNAYIRAGFGL